MVVPQGNEVLDMFEKGVAVEGLTVSLMNKYTGEPVTDGVAVAYVTKDGGTQAETEAVPVYEGNGQWSLGLTAAEMTADSMVGVIVTHPDAFPVNVNLPIGLSADVNLGPGADSVTVEIRVAGDPVPDADVWISSDPEGHTVIAGTLQTDSNGNAVFLLDDGDTYYLWMQKDGYDSILGEEFVAEADP
jgi:hypothetical protein